MLVESSESIEDLRGHIQAVINVQQLLGCLILESLRQGSTVQFLSDLPIPLSVKLHIKPFAPTFGHHGMSLWQHQLIIFVAEVSFSLIEPMSIRLIHRFLFLLVSLVRHLSQQDL